jgi:hypothetical protein
VIGERYEREMSVDVAIDLFTAFRSGEDKRDFNFDDEDRMMNYWTGSVFKCIT